MAKIKRLVAAFSAMAMTLSLFGISAVSANDSQELVPFDYNGDGIVGPTDYKRLHSADLGQKMKNVFLDMTDDDIINVADEVILKRTILKNSSEKLKDAESISTLAVDDSIMVISYNIPEEKRADWEYTESLLPDGVYETREKYESEVLQYINLDEGNNKFRERLDEKFDAEFFEENSVIMVRKGRNRSYENLSLVDGTLTAECIYLDIRDGTISVPLAYDYIGMAIAVSKDVLAQYDYSAVTSVDNTKKTDKGEVSADSFPTIAFPESTEALCAIESTAGLSEYLGAMTDGVFRESDSLSKITEKYDDAFFEKNKLVAYHLADSVCIGTDSFPVAYYDNRYMSLSVPVASDYFSSAEGESCGTLIFVSANRELFNDEQKLKVYIWHSDIDF